MTWLEIFKTIGAILIFVPLIGIAWAVLITIIRDEFF